ncbi:MAG TPA: helix-turn-helix domain-containing protein [Baekduia sp.]|jgi:transcriptional regulator with XRE-family HTH domain
MAATPQTATSPAADALRAWRRRRGYSQLDLALRADTTQRHLSFVESGRSRPGRSLTIRLAEALEIPLRERNAILLAGGHAPAYADAPLDDARLGPVRAALEHVLTGHLPYPAALTDRDGTLISANGAFDHLIAGVDAALLRPPVNLARLLLHPDGLRPDIINFDQWGRHVLDGLRRKARRNDLPRLAALADELEPFVGPRVGDDGPTDAGAAVPLRLRTAGGELQLLTTLAHFATTIDVTLAELTLEAFLPADEATAAALRAATG